MKSKLLALTEAKVDVSRPKPGDKRSDYTNPVSERWTVKGVLTLMRSMYPDGPRRRYTVEVQAKTGASWSTVTAASKQFQREHVKQVSPDSSDEVRRLRSRVLELEELLVTADDRAEQRFVGDRAFFMRSIDSLKTELESLRTSTGRAHPARVIVPEEAESIYERQRK